MTKVCFINTNIAWGGGEKWHFEMANILSQAGHDVSMVVHPESQLGQKISNSQIKKYEYKISKLSFICPMTQFKISNFFNQHPFDAVIMNLPNDVKAFAKAAKKAGIKNVIYRRGMNHPIKSSWLNNYIYKNFVTSFIANSENVKFSIYRYIPELKDRTQIIYNAIEKDNIKEAKAPSEKQILIGNLGRLVDQKAQHYLIELGKILKDKGYNYKIYIAGEGPLLEKLSDSIKQTGQTENIFLLGMTSSDELFSKIDYFVFTSKFEGLSNAILESLQFRKPVICFDTASNAEIIENNINGIIVPPYEVTKMAESIIELHTNKKKYSSFQEMGKKTLIEKFNQEEMIHKLEELIAL